MNLEITGHARRWSPWSLRFTQRVEGNPFTDHTLLARFTHRNEQKTVMGFYDGNDEWQVRFMPSFEGEYCYEARLDGETVAEGVFHAEAPEAGSHGPVRVAGQYHFAYEDGTPYYSIGTTCYVWALQDDDMIAQTLETLKASAFNKIRFCVFPKHYPYNLTDPRSFPFEGTPMDCGVLTEENFHRYNSHSPGNDWDFSRPNPAHFRHLEHCIERLGEMGIEADLILFHPYDRWGFSCMTPEQDELYLRYVIARFAAFRNVWWSLANEYDLIRDKSIADWERIAQVICENDPYHHLRSIHNCVAFYDHRRPWITHCSIQRQDLYKTAELTGEWRAQYGKPVVLDEIAYEGDIQFGWGNISGEEMLRRFWECALRGGYPGHGETLTNPTGRLWWSHGGKLYGESAKRFGFLLEVLKETPGLGLAPCRHTSFDEVCAVPESPTLRSGCYYLYYYSFMRPSFRDFHLDDTTDYQVTVLDTWNMTRQDMGIHRGSFRIKLPARPYMAVQLRRVASD